MNKNIRGESMKKLNKLFKYNKIGCLIISGLFFGVVIAFFIMVFVVPSLGENNYGNRLDDSSKYKIESNNISDIKDTISSKDGVNEITYHKEGRILNFKIKVDNAVVLDTAKKYAEEIVNKIDKKNLKYYDVQIFLDADESDIYPIIGYRAKGEESSLSWGNVGGNK